LREIAVHLVYDVPIKEKCWNSLQCSSFIDDRPANPSSFVEISGRVMGRLPLEETAGSFPKPLFCKTRRTSTFFPRLSPQIGALFDVMRTGYYRGVFTV
jgi:hypothetical protein